MSRGFDMRWIVFILGGLFTLAALGFFVYYLVQLLKKDTHKEDQ